MGRTAWVLLGLSLVTVGTRSIAHADVPATVELAGAPAALTRLFQAPSAKAEWFAPAFLDEVPIAQVDTVLSNVRQQFGAFKSVDGSGLDYVAHLARGSVHVRVVVDSAGLIAGLLIKP